MRYVGNSMWRVFYSHVHSRRLVVPQLRQELEDTPLFFLSQVRWWVFHQSNWDGNPFDNDCRKLQRIDCYSKKPPIVRAGFGTNLPKGLKVHVMKDSDSVLTA